MSRSANLRHTLAGIGVSMALIACPAMVYAQSAADAALVRQVTPVQASALIQSGALVIDVRDAAAYQQDHIPGAVRLTVADLQAGFLKLAIARDRPIVVYCNDGTSRGPAGTAALKQVGYTNVVNLQGGFELWAGERRTVGRI